MANKRVFANEGEWAAVIKAQDNISKKILQEEQEIQKQAKIRYKEELDKQLKMKDKMIKSQFDDKQEEKTFHKAQELAMKNFEYSKKQDDRSYQHLFL